MDVILKSGETYSFSPDNILNGSALNAYNLIDQKNLIKSINLLYRDLGKLDKKLSQKKIPNGLKHSIINEIFINSSIFFFIFFLEHKKIKHKIKKIKIVKSEIYLKTFIKKYLKINIQQTTVKKNLKYNKFQILKQLNFKEIDFYLKKKIIHNHSSKKINEIIYKECPLLINDQKKNKYKNTFYLRDYFKIRNIKNKKRVNIPPLKFLDCFRELINLFKNKKIIKFIINDLYNNGVINYFNFYYILNKQINHLNIENKANFHSSLLTSAKDFALLDLMKNKYNSKIITYQHGHGQGLSQYHDMIKFFKESSYSDINYVFSDNAKKYDTLNNSFSKSKTITSKYYDPYNKILTKTNLIKNKFDIIYFSPWHMNGTNHSLYNYGINDLEKIKIENDLINNYLSKSKSKILIKKYPYDLQKYKSEKFTLKLVSNYSNLTYYDKTLKYPEFYKKNQIILMFGCSSTFGYLASFNNPIIMINLKNFFPVKKKLEYSFRKSIFLVDYLSLEYHNLLNNLIYDKKFIYKQWKKKSIYREKFYKKYLGIT